MRQSARQAADVMKALANENRLLILCHLAEGERSVGVLADAIGMRQAAASQQLSLLRRDGLVSSRREAQTVYYALAGTAAPRLVAVLYDIFCSGPDATSDDDETPPGF